MSEKQGAFGDKLSETLMNALKAANGGDFAGELLDNDRALHVVRLLKKIKSDEVTDDPSIGVKACLAGSIVSQLKPVPEGS